MNSESKEKGIQPSVRKVSRKKIVLSSVLAVLIAAGGVGFTAYRRLQPAQHFTHKKIPVIAKPTGDSVPSYPPLHNGEFNLLLLGVDSRAQNQAARTDSILIIHVDLNRHDYEVISIPRDTRVDLRGYGETKITHANFLGELNGGLSQGTKEAVQAISNLTGLQINYYAETDYWGLKGIVDDIGGIQMYVPFTVHLTHPWYPQDKGKVFQQGTYTLDGQMVTEIVHERYSLPDGDFGREKLQEEALIGIARKLLTPANVSKIPTLVNHMSSYLVTTNLTKQDMLSLGFGVKGFTSSQVHYYQVPGHPALLMDPVVGQKLYYWIPDQPALQRIIKQHFVQ